MLELLQEKGITVFVFAFLTILCLVIINIRAKRRIVRTDLYTGVEFVDTFVCLLLSFAFLSCYLIFFFAKKDSDFYWLFMISAVSFIMALYFFLRDRVKIQRRLEKKKRRLK